MATCGRRMCFHGAFSTRAKAERKARQRGGEVIERYIRGSGRRFVVMTQKGRR